MRPTWGQRRQYGDFEIVITEHGDRKLLGQGNFGKTFEAVRSDSVAGNVIEERVALKVLNPDVFKSESKRVQFVREHTALARLKHANLVHSIKCGEDDGEVYFAMELCMGGDLVGLVKRFGALPEKVAAMIGLQAAAGLREMHRREMIHRDIKPPNIMLFETLPPGGTLEDLVRMLEENNSLCRIVDFGLVGTIMSDLEGSPTAGTQKFVGSMMYASPEQILERKDIDGRTDIYALGMTLWYLVQGRGPLLDQRSDELKHASEAEERHLSSREYNDDLPTSLSKEFGSILSRMVAKRPEERFSNARDLATALERYLEKSARVRAIAHAPVQSKEGLHAFYSFKGDALKSISRRRFMAENRATKQIARLTIVEDLDNLQKIRADLQEVVKKIFAMSNTLRQLGTPASLLPMQDVIWAADALAYAEDMPEGPTLAEVLQARTATRRPFSFREAEVIFRPIAVALDHLINQGWEFISLPCEEVWVTDRVLAAGTGDKELLCRPLDQWEDLKVTFSGMWVPAEKDRDQGAEALYASIADSRNSSSMITAESLRPSVSAFLRLVYRTLSGSDVPDAADRWPNGYISSVALQTASNNLIRDLLCKQIEWSSVTLILNELCVNEGVAVEGARGSVSRLRMSGGGSSSSQSRWGSNASRTSWDAGVSGSVSGSRQASRSAASSFYQPPLPPQATTTPEPKTFAQASTAHYWSQDLPSQSLPERTAQQEADVPKRGKSKGLVAGAMIASVVAVLATTFAFFQWKASEKVTHEDPGSSKPREVVQNDIDPKAPEQPLAPVSPPALSVPDAYRTLAAALASAKPGETVRVKAGAYEEQLRLPDGVSLVAEESRRVSISLDGRDGSVLIIDGCKTGSSIKGIVFSHKGTDAPDAEASPVVNVVASKVDFEDCVFEKGKGTGVHLINANKVNFKQCEARRNGAHGYLAKSSNAKLEGCLTEGNGNDGLRAYGAGCIVETLETISKNNGDTGFVAENGARISASKTNSLENSENGVAVLGADSETLWRGGIIQGNGVSIRGGVVGDSERGGQGVVVEQDSALFSATETVIADNRKAGVVMKFPKSNSNLIHCKVQRNQGIGVIIYGTAATQLRIEGGEIIDSHEEGLVIAGEGFRPAIEGLRIMSSTLSGLSVFEQAEPQLKGCTIEKNGQGPIDRAEAGPGMTLN